MVLIRGEVEAIGQFQPERFVHGCGPGTIHTLADAAKGVSDVVTGTSGAKKGSAGDVRKTSILMEKTVRRFGGVVKVGLKKDAFDKAPRLKKEYPMDEATGKIWLDVPLKGRLQSVTLALAERLYVLGRNRK